MKVLFILYVLYLKRKILKIVILINVDNKKIVCVGNKGVVCIEEIYFVFDDGYLI